MVRMLAAEHATHCQPNASSSIPRCSATTGSGDLGVEVLLDQVGNGLQRVLVVGSHGHLGAVAGAQRHDHQGRTGVHGFAAVDRKSHRDTGIDRGFGDQKLYRFLTEDLKFDYVIRFRGNITVTTTAGETRTAAAFVGPGGRARVLRGAWVTADRYQVGTVLCVQDKEMKQAWYLAASSADVTDLAIMLSLAVRDWEPVVDRAASSIAARLAGRLRRGIEFSVAPA